MNISLTSLLVSMLSASLLVIFISILILNKNIVAYLKPQYLLLCVLLISIRCFLPYEFFYTITLKSRSVLPLIQKIRRLTIPETTITVEQILVFIWIAVALLKLSVLLFKQYRTERAIKCFPVSKKMPELRKLLCTKNISGNIQLIEIPQLSTPALVGLRTPKIVIPCNVPEHDLHYILLHELEHYKRHDLYFIAILHLLCVIYWWNPAIYLLKYSALKVIEYRIDDAVVQRLNEEGKLNYLQSIINIIQLKNRRDVRATLGIGLYEKKSDVYQRFRLILEGSSKKSGHYLPKIVFALVILSTTVIFEPYFIPKEIKENTFNLNGDCFLAERSDGLYDLYINDVYYLTVDRTDGFKNLPIYKEDQHEEP